MPLPDTAEWHAHLGIRRWDAEQTDWVKTRAGLHEPQAADFDALGVKPYDESEVDGNLLTTAGLNRITSLIIGAGGQALTNTAARLGVGNGVGTAAVGDTDLSAAAGSTNRWFNVMDASQPTQANGVITAVSTFTGLNGNFSWNEWAFDIGTPTVTGGATVNALLLNHKTSIAQGTKASGQTWTATASITFS